jgi:hypothetical protein
LLGPRGGTRAVQRQAAPSQRRATYGRPTPPAAPNPFPARAEGVEYVLLHPEISYPLAAAATLAVFPGVRRRLFRMTLGRFRSPEVRPAARRSGRAQRRRPADRWRGAAPAARRWEGGAQLGGWRAAHEKQFLLHDRQQLLNPRQDHTRRRPPAAQAPAPPVGLLPPPARPPAGRRDGRRAAAGDPGLADRGIRAGGGEAAGAWRSERDSTPLLWPCEPWSAGPRR